MDNHKPAHIPDDLFIPGNIWGQWGAEPRENLKELIGGRDIVFIEKHYHPGHSAKGMWLVNSEEAVRQVLLDSQTFTSRNVKAFSQLLGGDYLFFPVEVDPPNHAKYRNIIAPYFSPPAVKAMKDVITKRVDDMLDQLIPKGGCDFVSEFARLFPASIFLDIAGLPRDRADEFLSWSRIAMASPVAEEKQAAYKKIGDYLQTEVTRRQKTPQEDLLSYIINSEVDGRPVTVEEATGCAVVLFIGGLDTVANQLSWTFKKLAEDQALQALLRKEPERIPYANEELFRFFSGINLARQAVCDVEIAGVKIKAGDTVTCNLTLANRDDKAFQNADLLDIDRPSARRHVAFGYGPHVCIGMRLARLEMNTVLERWLTRIANFQVAPEYHVSSTVGAVIALDSLPITWC